MLKNYLKIAFKVFLRRKFFTFISLFGIAFTIVVLMVVTAMADRILGARPPETRADRTLGIYFAKMSGPNGSRSGMPGYALLDRYARDLPGVELESFSTSPLQVPAFRDGLRFDLYRKYTDGAYWRILEFRFLEGRPFTEEESRAGALVAVINETTRARYFGDRPAEGREIEVDRQRLRVVGVVPDVPMFRLFPFSDVWQPLGTMPTTSYRDELVGGFFGFLLARSEADLPGIQAEFQSRLAAAQLPDPKTFDRLESGAHSELDAVVGQFTDGPPTAHARRNALLGVTVLALLFMSLPAINLININVSRILERESEIGVRKAFGASSWTLVGQFVVENVLLSLVGGMIGLVAAYGVLALIAGSGMIPYAEFDLNLRVFALAILYSVVFGLLSGVYPAWRMSRLHPVLALRGGQS